MQQIVLASNNAGKLREFSQLLATVSFEVLPQKNFDMPEAEETGLSFVENAILKARNATQYSGLPALADDSGLEVDALNGAPGIYSARYAGVNASDAGNNAKLLDALKDVDDAQRTARFQCVIAYLRHAEDPTPIICQGAWEGRILREPLGKNGFGYDPLFWVASENASSAQLPAERKNQLSHRGRALRLLLDAMR
jgi:XTP/dITP diphosphohydrolase